MVTTRSTMVFGLVFSVLCALLIASAAHAQSFPEGVRAGAKAALTMSNVRGDVLVDDDDVVDLGTAAGFSIGGLVTFETHPNVTIQPEILYSAKNIDVLEAGSDADSDVALGFIEIPVLAKLHPRRGADATPFVLVGGTLSFVTGAELRTTAGRITVTEDIQDEIDSTDIGLTFGGGIDLQQDWGIVTIDARYTLALGDLPEAGDVKLDTFSIGGGVIF